MTMRVGGKHHWTYQRSHLYERKIKPGVWKISWNVNKRQNPKGRGVDRGSRYVWKWTVYQRAVKTAPGRYKTRFTGYKRLVKARVKKRVRR